MKRLLLSLVLTVSTMFSTVWAYDFYAVSPSGHTLYYEIISGTTNVKVVRLRTAYNNYISGNVIIPDTVSYNGTTYNVTEFGLITWDGSLYGTFQNCSSLTSITIPNSVTSIGNYAFSGCSSLTSVTIPNSVTSIGNYAFSGCSSLTSVTIPNSVTTIGSSAFYECSGLTSVTIPNSVTTIGSYAFSDCSGLIFASIGNSVTDIGYSAFEDCSSLISASIGNSVTDIGYSAFEDCSSLTSVTIPNSVTFIGSSAFYNCSSLSTLNFNAINCSDFSSTSSYHQFYGCPISTINIGDTVQHIPANFVYNKTSLTTLTIGKSITSISSSEFSSCSNLTTLNFNAINCSDFSSSNHPFNNCPISSINIGDSVQRIPAYFAYSKSSLSAITIPNSVTDIGNYAFRGCSSLTSVTIPNSVTSIGSSAFQNCSSLISASIGNSVTSIGNYAFSGCSSLTSVNIPNSVTSIGSSAFQNCSSLISASIGNSVTDIGYSAFEDCSSLSTLNFNAINCSYFSFSNHPFSSCPISAITIGDSVQHIPANFIYNKTSLTNLTIGKNITSISSSEFSSCSNLTTLNFNAINCSDFSSSNHPFNNCPISSINIGDSVQRIPAYFAYNKDSLTSVTIPNSVASIGESAFRSCFSLTTLNFNAINCSDFSYYYNYDDPPFYNCPISTINIGDSVQRIPAYFAYNLDSLSSITIPNSVTYIGSYAFRNCSSLATLNFNAINCSDFVYYYSYDPYYHPFRNCPISTINIGDSVQHIPAYFVDNDTSLTNLTIGNSVTDIGNYAFRGCTNLDVLNFNAINCSDFSSYHYPFTACPISTINIGDSVQRIPAYFAYNKDSLTSVTIPNSATTIGDAAFYNCSGLTSVSIPNSVTYIGHSAFYNCSGLTSVTIPNSVTYIGHSAFYNCSGLTSVTIPNSVTYIRDSTFYNCGLTSLTIPNLVTSIGNAAFYNCDGLTSVTIPNSVTSIGSSAFESCNGLNSVTIPNSVTSIGSSAFRFSSLDSVTIPNSVTYIGYSAFESCNGLTSVTIPNHVNYIGKRAFAECVGLRTLNYNAINCSDLENDLKYVYNDYGFPRDTIYTGVFPKSLKRINIGDSVQRIPANFAYAIDSLMAIIIPNNVTSIGNSAFNSCSNLRDVTSLATTPPSLGSSCFSAAGILKVPCGSLNSYRYSSWLDYFTIMEEICDNITITVSSANENMGTVSGGGEYAFGTQVTITATPNQGYRFVCWNDGNTNNPRTITATTNATYIATFEENTEPETYTITVMSANNSMGSVSGGGTYEAGSQITITANAVEGYHFTSWNDGNTDNPRTITVTEDATYIASFAEGVGIESANELDNLTFYPNPTKGILNFNMEVEKIEVMDMMGKMVMQFYNVSEINIGTLPKGVYCLKLSYNDKATVHKIIKE